MPRFNFEKTHIDDLVIEEPEKREVVFDLDKDITKEDWELLKKDLEKLKKDQEYSRLLYRARSLKMINPGVDVGFNRDDLREMVSSLLAAKHIGYSSQESHDGIYLPGFIYGMAAAKTIDPDFNFQVSKEDWQKVEYYL